MRNQPAQKTACWPLSTAYDWYNTLYFINGSSYISRSFYIVAIAGTVLVILSGIAGLGLQDDRVCRAWCSRFALGTQPHSYMGFILFLIIAFRTREAYRMYQSGLLAHYKMKSALRRFVSSLLYKIPQENVESQKRARMVAFAIALPYAVTADMREERRYGTLYMPHNQLSPWAKLTGGLVFDADKGAIDSVLSDKDLADLCAASSMPLFIIESLIVMVRKYCEGKCSTLTARRLYNNLEEMYPSYGECERIKQSPCAFAYVAHLRFLLVAYLVTLPLALVEQMGFSTIPVYWVICFRYVQVHWIVYECMMAIFWLMYDVVLCHWRWWLSRVRSHIPHSTSMFHLLLLSY